MIPERALKLLVVRDQPSRWRAVAFMATAGLFFPLRTRDKVGRLLFECVTAGFPRCFPGSRIAGQFLPPPKTQSGGWKMQKERGTIKLAHSKGSLEFFKIAGSWEMSGVEDGWILGDQQSWEPIKEEPRFKHVVIRQNKFQGQTLTMSKLNPIPVLNCREVRIIAG